MGPEGSSGGTGNTSAISAAHELKGLANQEAGRFYIPIIHAERREQVVKDAWRLYQVIKDDLMLTDEMLKEVDQDLAFVDSSTPEQISLRTSELSDEAEAYADNPSANSKRREWMSMRHALMVRAAVDSTLVSDYKKQLEEERGSKVAIQAALELEVGRNERLTQRLDRTSATLTAISNEDATPGIIQSRIQELEQLASDPDLNPVDLAEIRSEIQLLQSVSPEEMTRKIAELTAEEIDDSTGSLEDLTSQLAQSVEQTEKLTYQRDMVLIIATKLAEGDINDARSLYENLKKGYLPEPSDSDTTIYPNLTDRDEEVFRTVESLITSAEQGQTTSPGDTQVLIDKLNSQAGDLIERVLGLAETNIELRETNESLSVNNETLNVLNQLLQGDTQPAQERLEFLQTLVNNMEEDSAGRVVATENIAILERALNAEPQEITTEATELSDTLVQLQTQIADLEVEKAALTEQVNGHVETTPLTQQIVTEILRDSDSDVAKVVIEAMIRSGVVRFESDEEKVATEFLLGQIESERETEPTTDTDPEDLLNEIQRELATVLQHVEDLRAEVDTHPGTGAGGDEQGDQAGVIINRLRELLERAEKLPEGLETKLEEAIERLEATAAKLVEESNAATITISLSDIGNPVVSVNGGASAGFATPTSGTVPTAVPVATAPFATVPMGVVATGTSAEFSTLQTQINTLQMTLQTLLAQQATQAAVANPALVQQSGLPQQLSGSCEQLLREMQQQNATTNQVLERMAQLIESSKQEATPDVASQINQAIEANNAQLANQIGQAVANALEPLRQEISGVKEELEAALAQRDAEWNTRMQEMEERYEQQMTELRELLRQSIESRTTPEDGDELGRLNQELEGANGELARLRLIEFLMTDLGLQDLHDTEPLAVEIETDINDFRTTLDGLLAAARTRLNEQQLSPDDRTTTLLRIERILNILATIDSAEGSGTQFQNAGEVMDHLNNMSVPDYMTLLERRITNVDGIADLSDEDRTLLRERIQQTLDTLRQRWDGLSETARASTTSIALFLERRDGNEQNLADVRNAINAVNTRIADLQAQIAALAQPEDATEPTAEPEATPEVVDARANRAALEANLGALGTMLEAKPEKVKGWKKFLRAAAEVMTSMAGGLVMKAGIATLVGVTVGAAVMTGPMAIAIAGFTGAIGGAAFNGLFSGGLHYGLFHKEKHKIWAENSKKGNGALYFFKNAIRKGTIEDYDLDGKLSNLSNVFNRLSNPDIASYTFADLQQYGLGERDVLNAFKELLILKELTNYVGLDGIELPNGVAFGAVSATEAINRLATQIPAILNANGYDANRIASVQQLANEEIDKRYNDAFRSVILNKMIKGGLIGGFTGAALSVLEQYFSGPAQITEAAKDEATKNVAERLARTGSGKASDEVLAIRTQYNIDQVAALRGSGLGKTEIDAIFAQADINKDGVISGSAELAKLSSIQLHVDGAGVEAGARAARAGLGAASRAGEALAVKEFVPGSTQLPAGWSDTLQARNLSNVWTLGPSGGDHGKLYIDVFNQIQGQVGESAFSQGETFDKVVWPAIQDGIRNGYQVNNDYIGELISNAGISTVSKAGVAAAEAAASAAGTTAEAAVAVVAVNVDSSVISAITAAGQEYHQHLAALEMMQNAAGNVVEVGRQVTGAPERLNVPEFVDKAARAIVDVGTNGWYMLAGALGAGAVSAALYSPDSENVVGGTGGGQGGTGGQGGGNTSDAAAVGAQNIGITGAPGTNAAQNSGNNPGGNNQGSAERTGLNSELGVGPTNPENQTITVDPATGRFVAPANTWRAQTGTVDPDTSKTWLEFRNTIDSLANFVAIPFGRQKNPFRKQAERDALQEIDVNNKYYLLENGVWYEKSVPLATKRQRQNQVDARNQYDEIRKGSRDTLKKMVADVLKAEFPNDQAAQRLNADDQWALANFGEAQTRTKMNDETVDSFWALMMVLNDPSNIGTDGKLRQDKLEQFHGIVTAMFARENQFSSTASIGKYVNSRDVNTKFTTYRGIPALVSHAMIVAAMKLSDFNVDPVQMRNAPLSFGNVDQLTRSVAEVKGGLSKGLQNITKFNAQGRFDWTTQQTAPTA